MVEKISLNVEIPGLNVNHNYLIPEDMMISKVTNLILNTLLEEYPEACNSEYQRHFILHMKHGEILNPESSLKQLGIVNGDSVILM